MGENEVALKGPVEVNVAGKLLPGEMWPVGGDAEMGSHVPPSGASEETHTCNHGGRQGAPSSLESRRRPAGQTGGRRRYRAELKLKRVKPFRLF